MPLVDKSTAMYFQPESIGSPDGARCGICWKFDAFKRACVEVEGVINGVKGICGLYVNGEPIGDKLVLLNVVPSRKVEQAEAGYSERGPTHCGNCDEMFNRAVFMTSPCKKVAGLVDGRACCNLWEKA